MKKHTQKIHLFIFFGILTLLSNCDIQGNLGPFEQDFSGFWKLKEIKQPDGKIIVANINIFF
jgi:hypothetical protein